MLSILGTGYEGVVHFEKAPVKWKFLVGPGLTRDDDDVHVMAGCRVAGHKVPNI